MPGPVVPPPPRTPVPSRVGDWGCWAGRKRFAWSRLPSNRLTANSPRNEGEDILTGVRTTRGGSEQVLPALPDGEILARAVCAVPAIVSPPSFSLLNSTRVWHTQSQRPHGAFTWSKKASGLCPRYLQHLLGLLSCEHVASSSLSRVLLFCIRLIPGRVISPFILPETPIHSLMEEFSQR